MIDVMIRISVLWIFFAVAYSVHYALSFFEPGALQKILSGENTTATKLVHMMLIGETCIGWLIPLTMAFLSVTLGDFANRNLNMVLGGLYALLSILHVAKCPIIHVSNKPSVHQLLIIASTIVVTALIFWYAWTW
jgi:hypothetical protein